MSRVLFVLWVALASGAAAPAAMQVSSQPQVAAPQPPAPARDTRATKPETGSIKGRVTSIDGKPLRRAQIRVSAAELREARTVNTDTDGNYEILELPAGRYTVRVSRSGYVALTYGQRYPGELNTPVRLGTAETISNINFALPRAAVIAGRVYDDVGEPVAGVSVYAMQLRFFQGRRRLVPAEGMTRTDDTGQYRLVGLTPGDYFLMATTRESWVVSGKDRTVMSFGPTYYPNAPSVSTAQRVKVGLGQEVSGMDVALVVGRAAAIHGVALTAAGVPLPNATVGVSQEIRGPTSMSVMSVASTTAGPDGAFKLTNVPPGEYRINSRGTGSAAGEGATQALVMDGTDIEGLTLVASAGGTVTGQVIVEGGMPLPVALSRLRVAARSTDGIVSNSPSGPKNGVVDDEGKFELTMTGANRIAVNGVPDGWVVKAIERDGVDLADVDVNMRSGERWDGVKVVIANPQTTVTGSLKADRDQQTGTGTIVLFRDDPTLWGEASRHIRAVRPSQTGEFEIKGLLPGGYFAVAVEYLPDGDWFDPEVLASLQDRATRLTLGDAETRALNLELKR